MGSFRVSKSLADTKKKRGRQTTRPGWVSKQGGNVVTYFCTPDMKVIHFVVGPAHSKTLLTEAKWAAETYKSLSKNASGDQLQRKLREAHLAKLSEQIQFNYNVACRRGGAGEDQELTESSRRAIVSASVPVGLELIRFAFTKPRKIAPSRRLRTQQHRHHMVLSRLAMVDVKDIEQPVFELLARQPYGRRSVRQDEALAIAEKCAEAKQPMLIVIDGRGGLSGAPDEFDATAALPKHRGVAKKLAPYKILGLSYNETNTLADDLGQSALPTLNRVYARATYVVVNESGKRSACILKTSTGYYIVFDADKTRRPFYRKLGSALSQAVLGPPKAHNTKGRIAPEGYRIFKSSDGNYSVFAKFNSMQKGKVHLTTSDGRPVTVTMKQLSTDDQTYLNRVIGSARKNRERLRTIAVTQGL